MPRLDMPGSFAMAVFILHFSFSGIKRTWSEAERPGPWGRCRPSVATEIDLDAERQAWLCKVTSERQFVHRGSDWLTLTPILADEAFLATISFSFLAGLD